MSNRERDKFLTGAMGETWHEWVLPEEHCKHIPGISYKCKCGGFHPTLKRNNNFSTWAGFGKLWEWSRWREWWPKFIGKIGDHQFDEPEAGLCECSWIDTYYIHPDRFANAVYEFLK